jgi:hypothetical protein
MTSSNALHDDGSSLTSDGGSGWLPDRAPQAEYGYDAQGKEVSALNLKPDDVTKPVYPALACHQRSEADWALRQVSVFLDEWWGRLVEEYGLAIPRTALRLEQNLRRSCLGYFRPGHNEFGLRGEIAIGLPPIPAGGRIELCDLDLGDLLGTLLHEQLHLAQALHGVPSPHGHHNLGFRKKARRAGLVVDYRGHQTYDPDGAFLDLLRRHNVPLPWSVALPIPAAGQQPAGSQPKTGGGGSSTLKKWTCGCTNVRVAITDFRARCLKCGREFARA